jgi:hypothetical protein
VAMTGFLKWSGAHIPRGTSGYTTKVLLVSSVVHCAVFYKQVICCAVLCRAVCVSRGDPEDWLNHVRQGHLLQQQQQQQHEPSVYGARASSSRRVRCSQQQQGSAAVAAGYGSGDGSGSGSREGGAAQPRPYFWRMQQHMMARWVLVCVCVGSGW